MSSALSLSLDACGRARISASARWHLTWRKVDTYLRAGDSDCRGLFWKLVVVDSDWDIEARARDWFAYACEKCGLRSSLTSKEFDSCHGIRTSDIKVGHSMPSWIRLTFQKVKGTERGIQKIFTRVCYSKLLRFCLFSNTNSRFPSRFGFADSVFTFNTRFSRFVVSSPTKPDINFNSIL